MDTVVGPADDCQACRELHRTCGGVRVGVLTIRGTAAACASPVLPLPSLPLQANALNLFAMVLVALHALRPASPGPAAQLLAKWATPASVAAVGSVAYAVTTQK